MFSTSSLSPQMISPSFSFIFFLYQQISSSSLPNKIISSLFYFTLFFLSSSSTFAQLFLLIDLKQSILNRNLYSNLLSYFTLFFWSRNATTVFAALIPFVNLHKCDINILSFISLIRSEDRLSTLEVYLRKVLYWVYNRGISYKCGFISKRMRRFR